MGASARIRGVVGCGALAVGVLHATAARADDPATGRRWYGYQTLATDVASAGLFVVGEEIVRRGTRDDGGAAGLPVALLGGLGYLLGGPIIHFAHGRTGVGFADLGARVALPLAGVGLGALVQGVFGRDNSTGAIVGAVVGVCAAVAFDAAVLGFDPTLFGSASTSSALGTPRVSARVMSFGGAF